MSESGPQYTEEQRRHRGFVPWLELFVGPGMDFTNHEIQAQLIMTKLMLSARSTPIGGPINEQ